MARTASTTIPAMVTQPAAPQDSARKVYAAGAQTLPSVSPSWATPWYSPRRSGSDSSARKPHRPADWNSSAPVTVTWPSQTSRIVVHPRVSWVTRTMQHDSTKNAALIRAARSDVRTEFTPRAAGTWSSTAITVLVPKSHASSTRGASVSCTSHSGITMLRSTWLVLSTPSKTFSSRKPRFRRALPPSAFSAGSSSTLSWVASGSRVMKSAFTNRIADVSHGTTRTTSLLSNASAMPPIAAPTVNPMLSAARMNAIDRTRSSRGNTSIVYAPRPDQPAFATSWSTTTIATYA